MPFTRQNANIIRKLSLNFRQMLSLSNRVISVFALFYIQFMSFKHGNTPPGAYPAVTQRRKINETKKNAVTKVSTTSLGFNSTTIDKLKSYFQHSKEQHVELRDHNKSRWRNFWFRKKQQHVVQHSSTSNTVAVGTVFSLSVPITISSHYYSKEETTTRPTKANSLVQQLVILPPLQVYGFLFLAILFLLVIAFALLQVHRIISILELGVNGIKYVLVGSVTNVLSVTTRLKWWF